MKQISLLVIASLVSSILFAVDDGGLFALVTSPDRRFIAKFSNDGFVTIQDSKTHEVISKPGIGVLMPVLEYKWTSNCESLMIVSHIAHGSDASIISLNNGRWDRVHINPPPELGNRYEVLEIKDKLKYIHIKYETTYNYRSRDKVSYAAIIEFDVSPTSGKVDNFSKTKLQSK